jgi:hypothetical protein
MDNSQFYKALSADPNAINILRNNYNFIDIPTLNRYNPNAYILLLEDDNLIHFDNLQFNPNSIPVYYKYPNKISWIALNYNPGLINYINTDLRQIDWKFSTNS